MTTYREDWVFFHLAKLQTRKVWNSCTIHFQDMIWYMGYRGILFKAILGVWRGATGSHADGGLGGGGWRPMKRWSLTWKPPVTLANHAKTRSICFESYGRCGPLSFQFCFEQLVSFSEFVGFHPAKGSSLLPANWVAGALSTKEFANPSVFTFRARRIGIAGWSSFAAWPCGEPMVSMEWQDDDRCWVCKSDGFCMVKCGAFQLNIFGDGVVKPGPWLFLTMEGSG